MLKVGLRIVDSHEVEVDCYLIVEQLVYLSTALGCAKRKLQLKNWNTLLKFIISTEVLTEEEVLWRK